jgi:hypothetical protein
LNDDPVARMNLAPREIRQNVRRLPVGSQLAT